MSAQGGGFYSGGGGGYDGGYGQYNDPNSNFGGQSQFQQAPQQMNQQFQSGGYGGQQQQQFQQGDQQQFQQGDWFNSGNDQSNMQGGFGNAPAQPTEQSSYTSHGFNPPPPVDMSSAPSDGSIGFDEEPPLLQELGINFDHIRTKTIAVLIPTKSINEEILEDTDMAGPLVFAIVQGFCLLFSRKLFFGYVFGFGVSGGMWLYMVINLMDHTGHSIDIYRVFSVLGYCLLPIVMLSAVTILFDLSMHPWLGTPLTFIAIIWCTHTATRFFEIATHMREQRYLIAYPVFLVYAC
eukprot:CAMPEP_0203745318 /NCGR_PEP_ID=MMETSP0098-20131031/1093_1 /ASSEMBLY_ACC=CAM_ASM_000208 /TAXON_ID=96639 /ORGANISM=" , Strain NY0313808BC1" /LENGTH=292 /DNA_ID=CAMNT_0050633059 /DNA_START=352 /DNA_END=1227 /DNA_ORIENTATION=-